jgi:endoglucanase
MKITLLKQTDPPRNLLLLLIFSLWFAGLSSVVEAAATGNKDAFTQCRDLGRGVNVLGYDPIWNSTDQARFKEEHFKIIRAGGFDTLRVNLYPFQHMGAAPKFQLSDSWWRTTDWVVSNALAAGLNVIIDLHEYEAQGKDAEGNKDRFLAFWRQVGLHFHNAPSSVLFEILNEPNGKMTPEIWNQYLVEALAVIRARNPTRTVVIGPAFYNSIDHLDELKLPDQDRHLIVTVHYYSPMDFTHQGASWVGRQGKIGVVWQGTAQERAAITSDFQKARVWATQHDRPIFLGEFGTYDKGDMTSRARYTGYVARTAERFGWSWAYWQFDSNFIVYDIPKHRWVEPIYHALIPPDRAAVSQTNRD